MFGAQQQYAHQISAGMPAPYQGFGIGAGGSGGGFGPTPGIGYSYGGGMANGYGSGNAAGNAGVSMIGGIGNAFFGSMGMAGGIMGGMRGGVGGAIAGFGIGSAIGAAGKHVFGSMMEGAQEQQGLERTLSQFQFQNAHSRTGKGFSRGDSMQIGGMVRQMERMPEMLTSFGELNRLMDKMGQMGLMQGVKDAGQFMDKFRNTINTLKDLSKLIGTSMEGALKAFGEARQSGFYSSGDIVKNVMNRQITGSLTGMNQGQVGALQQYGSQIGHGTGGSRRSGAQHALRTAGQLGMANQMGILSNDMIMEMTGKEGAEGIQDLSASMTQLGHRMGSSNVGQAMTLALGKMEDGRYTGEMDEELAGKVRRGEISLSELKHLARSKARGRKAKLSFAAHKSRLRSEMVGAVGAEGIGMQLQEILGNRGWRNPDATNLVMQRFGASEEQANMLQKLMPNLEEISLTMQTESSGMARRQARAAVMKERFSADAIKHKISKKIEHAITDPFKDAGRKVRDAITGMYEDFMDELTGEYTRNLTKGTAELVRNSMMGSSSAKSKMTSMIKGAQQDSGFRRGSNLGNSYGSGISGYWGGAARGAINSLSGSTLSGSQLRDALLMMGGNDAVDRNIMGGLTSERAGDIQDSGRIVLEQNMKGVSASTSMADINMALKRGVTGYNQDSRGAQDWRGKWAGTDSYKKGIAALQAGFGAGKFGAGNTRDQMRQMATALRSAVGEEAFQKMGGDMGIKAGSNVGVSEVISHFMGSKDMEGYYGAEGMKEKVEGLLKGFDTTDQRGISKRIEAGSKSLASSFKDTSASGGTSWASVEKSLAGDSTMRNLLLGVGGVQGLLDTGAVGDTRSKAQKNIDSMASGGKGRLIMKTSLAATMTTDGKAGLAVRRAIEKDPDKWTAEEKEAAALMGITPEYAAKNKDKLLELKKSIDAQGGDVMAAIRKQASDMGLGDVVEIERQFKETGGRMKDSMGRFKTTISGMGEKGQAAAKKLSEISEAMSSGSATSSGEALHQLGDSMGDLSGMIAGLPKEEKKKFMAMLSEGGGDFAAVQSMIGTHDRIMRKGKRLGKKKGADLHKFIGADAFGQDDNASEMWKELEGKFGKTVEKGELGELAKTLATGKGAELMAKAGGERTSSYISEQDIANSLKTMSENTKQAAEILKTLVPSTGGGTPPAAT